MDISKKIKIYKCAFLVLIGLCVGLASYLLYIMNMNFTAYSEAAEYQAVQSLNMTAFLGSYVSIFILAIVFYTLAARQTKLEGEISEIRE